MLFLTASLFYVNEPFVNMRESPTYDSIVVSQGVFSENVIIEKREGDWVYVETPDHYHGWMPANALALSEELYETSLKVSRLAAHVYGIKDTEFGPLKTLPYGSKLKAIDESDSRWIKIILPDGKEAYIQKGDVASEPELKGKEDLPAFSQRFLGLPYTWGGRSSFGYDCSGFIQMLYSKIGIALKRDSKDQIQDSRFQTIDKAELEPGDLIFFGRVHLKTSHVGMYIGNGKFIHATVAENQPWIRISDLSDADWSGSSESIFPYRVFRQFEG